jgi:uncharacterized membrane protein
MSLSTREPLVIRTAIVAAVTGLLHALVVLGYVPIDADQEQAVASAVDLLGTAVAVVWSRAAVTPVAGQDEAEPAEDYVPEHAAE